MMKVGVIGVGRIGRLHTRNLCTQIQGVEVVAVCDMVESAATEAAARFGIPAATADYRDVTADPLVDAVVVCSSTDTHATIIEQAAGAGKHIFCEKPIALELSRIDAAIAAAGAAGVTLQIGFNRRFDANYRRVHDAVVTGEVGELHMIRITSRDPAPPPIEYVKVSGGLFLDMAIHDFDMARYIVGSEVEEVFATGAVRVDPAIGEAGDIDTAIITLIFENGVIGTIDNSRQAVYGYDQRVEAFGSKGMAISENMTPNRVRLLGPTSVSEDLPLNFFMERYSESYLAEMQAFVEAVEKGVPAPVDGSDGRIPVVVGTAALKSLKEKRPVRIEEIVA